MANIKRGEVDSDCWNDGQVRTMVFSFNTICTIEERLNSDLDSIFFSGSVSRLAIREAAAVGLKAKDRTMTSAKVGRLLDPSKMDNLLVAIFKGLAAANGQTPEQIAELERMILEETDSEGPAPDSEDEEAGPDGPLQIAHGGMIGTG